MAESMLNKVLSRQYEGGRKRSYLILQQLAIHSIDSIEPSFWKRPKGDYKIALNVFTFIAQDVPNSYNTK